MNIQEDYVSFEVAKLLKEKGFDVPCNCYGTYNGVNLTYRLCITDKYTNWNKHTDEFIISCPTLQIVMKWFRKKYNLCIVSLPVVTDDNGEAGCLWNYMISKKLEISHNSENLYESPETALNDAIKYCLENLI